MSRDVEVERVVPIANYRASGACENVIRETLCGLSECRQAKLILLNAGQSSDDADREIRQEIERAANRNGHTVLVIIGGDGSVQRVRQVSYAMGDGGGKIVFAHIACGWINGNSETYGIFPHTTDIRDAFQKGNVIAVDQMVTHITTEDGNLLDPRVALLAIGTHDAPVLAGVEMAREQNKSNVFKKILSALSGIQDMCPTNVTVRSSGGVIFQRNLFFSETIGGNRLLHVPVAEGSLTDGYMTSILVPGTSHKEAILRTLLGISLATLGYRSNPFIQLFKTNSVQFEFTTPVPIHLDAELQGETAAIDITCQPRGVLFLAP